MTHIVETHVLLWLLLCRTSLPAPMFTRSDFSVWSILKKCIGLVSSESQTSHGASTILSGAGGCDSKKRCSEEGRVWGEPAANGAGPLRPLLGVVQDHDAHSLQ